MNHRQYPRSALLISLLGLGLAGCTSGIRPESFRSSFLPPAPKPSVEAVEEASAGTTREAPEPPALQSSLYAAKEVPNYLKTEPKVPPRPQLDHRIRRADERFQEGRKLYLEGNTVQARIEFDKAIDTLLASPDAAPDRHVMEKKLEEMVDRIHRFDVEGLGAGDDQELAGYDKSPLQDILELTFPIDPSLKTKVKDQVMATTSQLPLEENDEVLRYINYFSSDRGKKTLISGLRRAGRYRDMIRRILDEEGVPRELIFLAQAESGFLPRALSVKSATGMWQFVQYRGQEYGLMQTQFTDDRLDPEKATRAGARHLRDLYQQFGDWYLAMAAYNCGPGCVSKAVQRTGYADFWQLRGRNVLPKETANYVPLILAMTIMVTNAKDYGLENIDADPPLHYDTVEMAANTNLSLVADLLDIPVSELRDLNPSLLKPVAPGRYTLRIPRGSTQLLMSGLNAVPPDKRTSWRLHRVIEGETLNSIAGRYRTAPANIASVNRASMADLRAGDIVVIPAAYAQPARVKAKTPRVARARYAKPRTPVHRVKATPAPHRRAPRRRASAAGPQVAEKIDRAKTSNAR
ncbi:MAG: transglycosylase SLT domain-containing protein [Bryobacterales bacterium]|nr:transglycosylase SLT domain-containing protein [Bryobacterales bacterium]